MNLSEAPTKSEDFDNLAVARHRSSGGEPDRRSHRYDHEGEQGGGEDDDGVGHRPDARPSPMVVEARLRDRGGERRAQRREVLGAMFAEPHDYEPGDWQLAEIEPIAQPRFEQPLQFGFRISLSRLNALRLRGDRSGGRNLRYRRLVEASPGWSRRALRPSAGPREASATRIAPPAARQARKVMIAMTITSARPAAVPAEYRD